MIDTFDSEEHISAGQKLRKNRIDRGVTLDEVARITRITKAYLLALEEDAYEKLPSEVYARGFLRIYSNFLGLPGDEILSLYQPGASGETPEPPVPAISGSKQDSANKSPAKRWLWSIPAICLAALSGFFFLGDKEQGLVTDKKSMKLSPSAENVGVYPLHNQFSSANSLEEPFQNRAVEDDIPPNDSHVMVQGIVLKMRALEDGYLDMTIDDAITQHYDLKAGDIIEWKADKEFSLDIGNAGGVEAELNGRHLKPFGEKGSPAHIVLSAGYDGEKTYH
jgi:cytoskeleton protein RodZ